jgi:hypothetical protein
MTNFSQLYKAATIVLLCGLSMFFVSVGQVVIWAMDRKAPFEVLSYRSTPTTRGNLVTINVEVKRHLSRMCGVTYSRVFIDSEGVTWDLTEGVRLMTAQALNELDKRNPSMLTIKVKVPQKAAVGPGAVMTVMEYTCNPIHQLYPIPVVMLTSIQVIS